MSGDTLKRVQAVKKWLEKAESSYSSHKEITGEINLIMAQAEMQRLKETRRPSRLYRWGLRGCAMIVAVGLFFGGSYIYQSMAEESQAPKTSMEMVQKEVETTPVVETVPIQEKQEEPIEVPAAVETPISASVEAETPAPAVAKATQAAPTVAPAAPVVAVPPKAAPALSEKEIQSVVGEAGRTLRGQV